MLTVAGTVQGNSLKATGQGDTVFEDNIVDFSDVSNGYVLTFNSGTNTWAGASGSGAVNWDEAMEEIDWSLLDETDLTGVNWEYYEGGSVNWDEMPTIQTGSINWDSVVNLEIQKAGITLSDIIVSDLSGINWDYYAGGEAVNWDEMPIITQDDINWETIDNISDSNINWDTVTSLTIDGTINATSFIATAVGTTTFSNSVSIGDMLTVANTMSGGSVKLTGKTSDPCLTLGEGSIFYNTTGNYFCYCDGTNDLKMNDNSTACFE
jgi:hypothetical protein